MIRGPRARRSTCALATAAFAVGCAHAARPEVTRPAGALRCEAAARLVDARRRTTPPDDLRQSATYPLSLAATGAGWVTDGAIVVTAGAAAGGLICAPILALELAAKSSGNATAECFVRVGGAVAGAGSPGIGRGVYRVTHGWRCPDFVPLAREVRSVSACFASRNRPGDAEIAFVRLLQLRSDGEISGCLPPSERAELESALTALVSPTPRLEPASPLDPPQFAAPPNRE
jgi:hypothetical protein